MKKQWIISFFNCFTLLAFLVSAIILSTYETGSMIFDEWICFTIYVILSGIQTMILVFKKNDSLKKVFPILLTSLKTYTLWLAFSHTQNLGFSSEGTPFYPVLIASVITVILSLAELFFGNTILLLSSREENSPIGKTRKKTGIISFAFYLLAVIFIIVCSCFYLFQTKNIQVYPPFFIIDGQIFPVPLIHDYYWTGLILQASIINFGLIPMTKFQEKKTARPKLTSMIVLVLGSLVSAFLCLFADQTGTKGIVIPTELVLLLFVAFSAFVLIAYLVDFVFDFVKTKKKID